MSFDILDILNVWTPFEGSPAPPPPEPTVPVVQSTALSTSSGETGGYIVPPQWMGGTVNVGPKYSPETGGYNYRVVSTGLGPIGTGYVPPSRIEEEEPPKKPKRRRRKVQPIQEKSFVYPTSIDVSAFKSAPEALSPIPLESIEVVPEQVLKGISPQTLVEAPRVELSTLSQELGTCIASAPPKAISKMDLKVPSEESHAREAKVRRKYIQQARREDKWLLGL